MDFIQGKKNMHCTLFLTPRFCTCVPICLTCSPSTFFTWLIASHWHRRPGLNLLLHPQGWLLLAVWWLKKRIAIWRPSFGLIRLWIHCRIISTHFNENTANIKMWKEKINPNLRKESTFSLWRIHQKFILQFSKSSLYFLHSVF